MAPSISPNTPPKNRMRKILLLISGFLVTLLVCSVVWIVLINQRNNLPVIIESSGSITPYVQNQIECDECLQAAEPYYDKAYELTMQGKYAEAITYFDTFIEKVPELALGYHGRSICYWQLSRNQRSYAEHAEYLQRAIADIDKAISLGMTSGDTYHLRYEIYLTLVGDQEFRENYLFYQNIAIDNLKTAIRAGTSEEYVTQELARELFNAGRCDEGWATIERIHAADGISAPPKAALWTIEALGYICVGKFDQALEAVDAGISIQNHAQRQLLRAKILSRLGRYEEALVALNELLDQNPYYYGYRYYQRAFVEYELGLKEQALSDIEIGSRYTWGGYQERSYVLGRNALDEGRKDEAIKHLQDAWSTLYILYDNHSLIPRIEQELADLGSGPPVITLDNTFSPTPMPTEMPFAGTAFQPKPVTTNRYGVPLPPDPVLTLIEKGIGYQDYSDYHYPVFQFQPTISVRISAIKELTLHTLVDDPNHQPFLFFVWNFKTGKWTKLSPTGSETKVESPEDYVDEQANLFVAIRYDDNENGIILNAWPEMKVVTEEGQELILDLQQ